jgi:hypothetical protein
VSRASRESEYACGVYFFAARLQRAARQVVASVTESVCCRVSMKTSLERIVLRHVMFELQKWSVSEGLVSFASRQE